MPPLPTFDIEHPLDAEDLRILKSQVERLQKREHVLQAFNAGLFTAVLLVFLVTVHAGVSAKTRVVAQMLFAVLLIAWVVVFSRAANANQVWRSLWKSLEPIPRTLQSFISQRLSESPKCAAYLKAVSAQGRPLLKLELDELRVFSDKEFDEATRLTTRERFK